MAWLTDWKYRKQILISGTYNASYNHTILLKVGESANAADYHFHVEGQSLKFPTGKDDSGDLRFTKDDGVTLLGFWVEKVDGTAPDRTAYCWVKISDNLSSDVNIYCYYANSNASNVSNGDAAFEFFDDFDGTSLDTNKWAVTGIGPTVSDGCLNTEPMDDVSEIASKVYIDEDTRYRHLRLKIGGSGGNVSYIVGTSPSFPDYRNVDVLTIGRTYYYFGGQWNTGNKHARIKTNPGDVIDIIYKCDATNFRIYKNGALEDEAYFSSAPTTTGVGFRGTSDSSEYSIIDYLFVRIDGDPEPAFDSAGPQEVETLECVLSISSTSYISMFSDKISNVVFSQFLNSSLVSHFSTLILSSVNILSSLTKTFVPSTIRGVSLSTLVYGYIQVLYIRICSLLFQSPSYPQFSTSAKILKSIEVAISSASSFISQVLIFCQSVFHVGSTSIANFVGFKITSPSLTQVSVSALITHVISTSLTSMITSLVSSSLFKNTIVKPVSIAQTLYTSWSRCTPKITRSIKSSLFSISSLQPAWSVIYRLATSASLCVSIILNGCRVKRFNLFQQSISRVTYILTQLSSLIWRKKILWKSYITSLTQENSQITKVLKGFSTCITDVAQKSPICKILTIMSKGRGFYGENT